MWAMNYAGNRKRKKAQSTLELAVLIGVIAAALVAMSIYMKRSLQGRFRQAADDIGEQYSPSLSQSQSTVNTAGSTKSSVDIENEGTLNERSVTTITGSETTGRTSHEELDDYDQEPMFK